MAVSYISCKLLLNWGDLSDFSDKCTLVTGFLNVSNKRLYKRRQLFLISSVKVYAEGYWHLVGKIFGGITMVEWVEIVVG